MVSRTPSRRSSPGQARSWAGPRRSSPRKAPDPADTRGRMAPRLTILLSGMIAADPQQGGATWAVLQYVLGFRRLGHDVFFVEPVAAKAVRPAGSPLAASDNAAYFRRVVADFGLADRAALLLA